VKIKIDSINFYGKAKDDIKDKLTNLPTIIIKIQQCCKLQNAKKFSRWVFFDYLNVKNGTE